MKFHKKTADFMLLVFCICVLTTGCSDNFLTLNDDNETACISNGNTSESALTNLGCWVGVYSFAEFVPPDQNMFYRFAIKKDVDADCFCAIIHIDGFQTLTRTKAKVLGDQRKIELVFDSYLPENIFYPYKEGDVLLSLEKSGEKLITHWGMVKSIICDNPKTGEYLQKLKNGQEEIPSWE
ncbi:MAG: DUF5991 domain-containing protein [Firmicutes bacterium]|nr:DUF5991 domain-containing protein [Bacillota bacterium]